MPVNYQIPPWLKPADTAGAYAKGFGLGNQAGHVQAQIAMERARLNQEATQQALAITLKQQQVEHENMVEQQKLEVAKAYHQQQTELQAQALQQKERVLQDKIKEEAARQLAITQFRQAVASGEDPAMAMLKYGAGNTSMSGPTSEAMKLLSERGQDNSAEVKVARTDFGEFPYLETRKGTVHQLNIPKTDDVSLHMLDQAIKNLPLQKRTLGTNYPAVASTLSQLYANKINALQNKGDKSSDTTDTSAPTTPAMPLKILALPPKGSEDQAIDGALYYTPKGVLQYNKSKKQFLPPSPQASIDIAPSDTEVADTSQEQAPDETALENA